jgi:hypothetical protein
MALAAAAACMMFAGCGSEHVSVANDYVEVQGTVTVGGKAPAKMVMIHFEPESAEKGRTDQAPVTDGKFNGKMAMAKYKVAFDVENPKGSPVPAKYTSFKTSDLTVTVSGSGPLTVAVP